MFKAAEERVRYTVRLPREGRCEYRYPLESRFEYQYHWRVGTSIPYLGREYKVAGGAGEGALTRPETVNIDVVVHHHVQQVLALLCLK
jgi:hypothetical protein